ncbi:phage holin family protein [Niabella aurantiaca]|uniref:phage holin family protein n=1 Tax=Niabella aurantiaca TaxID=379900 RepID=UPI00036BCD29|nr:phage holin family protein [Niabella aurantiaca]
MLELKEKLENVAEDVEEIAKTYYRLSMLNIVDKGSKLGSSFLILALVTGLAFFIFLFIGFGASYWIGQALGNPMLGFFVVAGFLLLVLILILALNKKTIQPLIRNIIIKNLYD